MTLPKQHLPGQFVHSIRRTSDRRYFLRPGFRTCWVLHYAFALAVMESRVVPSAELVMCNHRHGALLDVLGNRAHFHERYHGLIGAAMNRLLKRFGHFWDNQGPTETVVLFEEGEPPTEAEDEDLDRELEALFDDLGLDAQDRVLLYIWMNPIKANLVDRLRDYPGFVIGPDDWGTPQTVLRPPWVGGGYPPAATYTPMPPKKWAGRLQEAKAHYRRLIQIGEAFFRKRRRKQRKGLLGSKGLRHIDPFSAPTTRGRPPRRKPRFCGSSKLREKAIAAYGVWRENYEVARRTFRNGDRDVKFPAGTVQLRRIAGVCCRGAPLPAEDPMP